VTKTVHIEYSTEYAQLKFQFYGQFVNTSAEVNSLPQAIVYRTNS